MYELKAQLGQQLAHAQTFDRGVGGSTKASDNHGSETAFGDEYFGKASFDLGQLQLVKIRLEMKMGFFLKTNILSSIPWHEVKQQSIFSC